MWDPVGSGGRGVWIDDVISFRASLSDTLARLEKVLYQLRDFGLQLKAKKSVRSREDIGSSDLACAGLGKTSAPVCGFHGLLSSFHPGLSWSVGATGGIDPEGGPVCLD